MNPRWGPHLPWHQSIDFWLTCVGIGAIGALTLILASS